MITIRCTIEQHVELANRAAAAGQSINTYLLESLGLQSTTNRPGKIRGRKSPAIKPPGFPHSLTGAAQ